MSGLAVFFPEAVCEEVNLWRRRYDPYVGAWEPHITLVYPPFIPYPEWPRERGRLSGVLAAFEPFTVTLDGLGTFPGEPSVLWLRPNDGGLLARLHAAIETQMPEYVSPQPFDYIPHVTIGLFGKETALRDGERAVLAELHPVSFDVTEVVYMAEGKGEETLFERLPLGRQSAKPEV